MSLSKHYVFENRDSFEDKFSIMDELEMPISCEEVVKTTKTVKKRSPKVPNSKFYNYLLWCLDNRKHPHMLRYVPNSDKTEFEVIFTDRKNKKVWCDNDISLFIDLDEHLGNSFDRIRIPDKQINDCKSRFRSSMNKCKKWVKTINETKIKKCKTIRRFKILWRPSVGDSSGFNQEITGNVEKSRKKPNKKANKKDNKNIVQVENTNCLEISKNIASQGEKKQLNGSGESKNVTLENFTPNGNYNVASLVDFETEDYDDSHYSCLPNSQSVDDYRNISVENVKMVPAISFVNSETGKIMSSENMELTNILESLKSKECTQQNAQNMYTAYSDTDVYGNGGFEENQNTKNGQGYLRVNELNGYEMIHEGVNFDPLLSHAQNESCDASAEVYGNDGFEENQNTKNGQECLIVEIEYTEDGKIFGNFKSDPFLSISQNEPYDASNHIGETDDFANSFIKLGCLYKN